MSRTTLALLGMLALCGSARGAYMITPQLADGSGTIGVSPGDAFDLFIHLGSDASDQHNSAIFRVVFEHWSTGQPVAGLSYEDYDWQTPYENRSEGSFDDDSRPLDTDLPLLLDADTLSGPGYPTGSVDVELSNLLGGGHFGTGDLVKLKLGVPLQFATPYRIRIRVVPDTIADGFTIIPVAAGTDFLLVPEPTGLLVLALGVLFLVPGHGRR